MNTESIEFWRGKIDSLENDLIRILSERAECAHEIGRIKKANGLPVFDASREQIILDRICAKNPGPFSNEALKNIILKIMEETRALEAEKHQNEL